MEELRKRLNESVIDFGEEGTESFLEQAAMCDEGVLERYLETGEVTGEDMVQLIRDRKLFPCFFGSA